MDSVEAEGNSIDDAIDSALKMLGTTRDRVEVEILSNAARGLFGIGGRKARVRATLRTPIDAEPLAAAAPRRREPVQTDVTVTPAPSAADRHIGERARQVLQEILSHMDVRADVNVKEEDGRTLLELTGDSSGLLIGRRGQMLDALEYLLNRIVARDEGGSTRVVIDSQNYRARRREALEDLARRMGEQAKKRRRPVALNPLSPRDRRIVHVILQADPSLTTKSSGKGYLRRLIIIPEGAGKVARGNG